MLQIWNKKDNKEPSSIVEIWNIDDNDKKSS